MNLPMLVVDKNIEFSQREQTEWLKHGIATVRVDSMQEAAEMLLKRSFLIVAINSDNINYIPMLKIMSDISPAHIFIFDTNFTHEKQIEAFANGAAGYVQFQDEPEKDVQSTLSYMQSINERNKPAKRMPKIITCGNLTIFADCNKAFCNDAEIIFTPKEYDILYYLLINRNITLMFKQIARKVWGIEAVSNNAMWQVIIRIRKKLKAASFKGGNIINFRGVGYRFSVQPDK